MKQNANKHRQDVSFNEGDRVYLKLHPTTSPQWKQDTPQTVQTILWFVIKKLGRVACELQLPFPPVFTHYSTYRY